MCERARESEKEKVGMERYGLCSCGSIWVRGKKYGDTSDNCSRNLYFE